MPVYTVLCCSLFRVTAANLTDDAPRHYEIHSINSVSVVCVRKKNSLSLYNYFYGYLYVYLLDALRSEDSPTNHQCTMVRNKSYLTQVSAYPTSPNCPSGTNGHSSHSTAISRKPPDGTNPRSAKQQAIAKKMDTWCDHLRQRRLTSPRLPPTRINALAHRDNNKRFSDC